MIFKDVPKEIVCVAILGLTAIEIAAIINGINGTLRTMIVGVICLLAGITLPQMKLK